MVVVRHAFVALVVPATLALAACGSSSSGATPGGAGAASGAGGSGAGPGGGASGGGTGAGAGGSGAGGGTTAACAESGDLDIDGLWAAKVRLDVSLQSAPGGVVAVCPTDQKGASDLLVLFEIKQSGTTITSITPHACSFTLPSATAMAGGCVGTQPGSVTAQVVAAPALAGALPAFKLPSVGGKLSGTAPGAMFQPERVNVVLGSKAGGMNMAHWLPSAACDSPSGPKGTDGACDPGCVSDCGDAVDQDMDGNLGVTLDVCGQSNEAPGAMCHADDPQTPGWTLQGKAFLNVLLDPLLSGVAQSSCQIDGAHVDANITYDILGGNVWLSGTQIAVGEIIKAIPTFKVLPATSKFTALRVDGKHGAPSWGLDLANLKAACDTAAKQAKSAF